MAAAPPSAVHPRARPGSVERPINGTLYRSAWLLFGVPLLIALFSVGRPQALRPPEPRLPPVFDRAGAMALASGLSTAFPDRAPGTPGAVGAADWVTGQLQQYGLRINADRFFATIPGRGRVPLVNQTTIVPGRSPEALVVMAHRDDSGTGPGANDNASGVAALIELARSYALTAPASAGARGVSPQHTLVFVVTDGGAFGGIGADRFARTYRGRVLAVVDLDAIAGRGTPRLVLAGNEPRSPAASLVATAADRVRAQLGRSPGRPSIAGQLIDLAFPFSLYEQGPLVSRGIAAVTVTTAGDRPPASFNDSAGRLSGARLAQIGRSTQQLLQSLDQGVELAQGTSSYLYLGARIIRGWAVELVLIAALLPFLVAVVDLFARCRRRHVPLAPALRSYRSRLVFWLWTGALFVLFGLLGVWPGGIALPVSPETTAAGDWPVLGLLGLGILSGLGWLVARERLLPRRPVAPPEELAGATAALLVLAVVALLVVATNPFALIFLLPSLHAWLWVPQVRTQPLWQRSAVLAAGFAGPAILLGSLAGRYGLGLDAPWYLAELIAIHYVTVPVLLIGLGWLAAAAQMTALTAGRYAPYPSAKERPRFGPIRSSIRRLLIIAVGWRREPEEAEQVLER
ncbi:MAG: M28 family peptidase [Gaiellaceae bacterium]